MADTLQDFIAKTRQDLAHLPSDERERRLDAVSEQLARFVAVRLDQGIEEETAIAQAIQEFESGYQDALTADRRAKTWFGGNLSPVIVAALYCVVANKAVALLIGSLLQLVAGLSVQGVVSLTPSLLLATLAAAILLREGFPKIASTLSSSKTVEGNGARWTALNQGFIFLLSLVMLLLFRNVSMVTFSSLDLSTLDQSPVLAGIALVVLLLMLACPFVAGWIVARAVPRAGLCGVQIAAVTGALLSFADQCHLIIRSSDGQPFLVRTTLFIFLLLGQTILVGLAVTGAYLGSHDTSKRR